MQIVKRGADVGFSTSFTDSAGAAYTPATATLRVAYAHAGTATLATISMALSSGKWIAKWNSAVADDGQVDWFVSTTGSDNPVDQGSFLLVKNAANPDPA